MSNECLGEAGTTPATWEGFVTYETLARTHYYSQQITACLKGKTTLTKATGLNKGHGENACLFICSSSLFSSCPVPGSTYDLTLQRWM